MEYLSLINSVSRRLNLLRFMNCFAVALPLGLFWTLVYLSQNLVVLPDFTKIQILCLGLLVSLCSMRFLISKMRLANTIEAARVLDTATRAKEQFLTLATIDRQDEILADSLAIVTKQALDYSMRYSPTTALPVRLEPTARNHALMTPILIVPLALLLIRDPEHKSVGALGDPSRNNLIEAQVIQELVASLPDLPADTKESLLDLANIIEKEGLLSDETLEMLQESASNIDDMQKKLANKQQENISPKNSQQNKLSPDSSSQEQDAKQEEQEREKEKEKQPEKEQKEKSKSQENRPDKEQGEKDQQNAESGKKDESGKDQKGKKGDDASAKDGQKKGEGEKPKDDANKETEGKQESGQQTGQSKEPGGTGPGEGKQGSQGKDKGSNSGSGESASDSGKPNDQQAPSKSEGTEANQNKSQPGQKGDVGKGSSQEGNSQTDAQSESLAKAEQTLKDIEQKIHKESKDNPGDGNSQGKEKGDSKGQGQNDQSKNETGKNDKNSKADSPQKEQAENGSSAKDKQGTEKTEKKSPTESDRPSKTSVDPGDESQGESPHGASAQDGKTQAGPMEKDPGKPDTLPSPSDKAARFGPFEGPEGADIDTKSAERVRVEVPPEEKIVVRSIGTGDNARYQRDKAGNAKTKITEHEFEKPKAHTGESEQPIPVEYMDILG